MVKTVIIAGLIFQTVLLNSCSNRTAVKPDVSEAGASVKITMQNGKIFEGLLLQMDTVKVKLIDREEHKVVNLNKNELRQIVPSNFLFDFEGNIITNDAVSQEKGYSKTVAYGLGGTVLGLAAGFGVGLVLAASNSGGFLYPMAALGLAGGIYFGIMGSDNDEQAAISEIRKSRYKAAKIKADKKLAEEKKKLEEQRREKEKLLQEIKEKKTRTEEN